MALHTDVPTRTEVERLLAVEEPACVSLYLPTTPVTPDAQADRIAFKNQIAEAAAALREAGASADDVTAIEEALTDLQEDDGFWALQANSLAVFATPGRVRTYRLPNELGAGVHVGGRFHVKPLLRAITFPQAAFVLALAQGSVRLLEVAADLPAFEVRVPDLPSDVASAAGKASITDRSASGRLQGSEGQKVLMRQYARQIDAALRDVLTGRDVPLILAVTPPLDAIYRSVNSYPHLLDRSIAGNPEALSEAELAAASREVLDELYAGELAELLKLFAARTAQGRGAADLADVARAATFGAVDTLLVDIDADETGTIDPETGALVRGDGDGLTDEVARRTLLAGGRVVAVRADDLPGDASAIAILRYRV